jgi:hypothetical protein
MTEKFQVQFCRKGYWTKLLLPAYVQTMEEIRPLVLAFEVCYPALTFRLVNVEQCQVEFHRVGYWYRTQLPDDDLTADHHKLTSHLVDDVVK